MNTLSEGLIDICVTLVSHYIFTEFPIFNIPGLKQIVSFMITQTVSVLITKTEVGIYMATIPQHTTEQQKDFLNAITKNMEVRANGTPEEKAKARQDLIDNAGDFIRFSDH